jgi:hypothetical protein
VIRNGCRSGFLGVCHKQGGRLHEDPFVKNRYQSGNWASSALGGWSKLETCRSTHFSIGTHSGLYPRNLLTEVKPTTKFSSISPRYSQIQWTKSCNRYLPGTRGGKTMNLEQKMMVTFDVARRSLIKREFPVGAVVFDGDEIISQAHSSGESTLEFL